MLSEKPQSPSKILTQTRKTEKILKEPNEHFVNRTLVKHPPFFTLPYLLYTDNFSDDKPLYLYISLYLSSELTN